jgi:alcohol dehydrogenase (cytochrome c)
VEWNGPGYSRVADAVFVNGIDWCTTVKIAPVSELEGKEGLPWTGSSELRHPFGVPDSVRSGSVTALDAETGVVRWRYRSPTPMVAGVTPTAGGLVFTGDLIGDVIALDAGTGAVRWRYATGRPVGGGVVTYLADGRQYVAVAAGMHAPVTWRLESPPAEVVVFGAPPRGGCWRVSLSWRGEGWSGQAEERRRCRSRAMRSARNTFMSD